jgi:hypothetical protein
MVVSLNALFSKNKVIGATLCADICGAKIELFLKANFLQEMSHFNFFVSIFRMDIFVAITRQKEKKNES